MELRESDDKNDEKNDDKNDNNKINLSEILEKDIIKRGPSCSLIIIDNFYNNPYDTRNYILKQQFSIKGNYPGQRTISYATENLKKIIQKYVLSFGGKITHFLIPKADGLDAGEIYNGSFQYTTIRDKSWVHVDEYNNWAGVLYLTPNAPLSAGTTFYRFKDGTTCKRDRDLIKNNKEIDRWSQDLTKWEEIDKVGNVFN